MRIPVTLFCIALLAPASASNGDDASATGLPSLPAAPPSHRAAIDVALAQEAGDEQQPPQPLVPSPPEPQRRMSLQPARASRRTIRLARAPNMFGDFFPRTPAVIFTAPSISTNDPMNPTLLGFVDGEIQNPLFGGGPRLRISENNSAVPQSRVYVNYNYYHNLGSRGITDAGVAGQSSSLNVYTLGTEVPLFNEDTSIAFQLPIYESVHGRTELPDGTGDTLFTEEASAGRVGNLAVVLKQALYENDAMIFSGGLGVSLPTGDGVTGHIRRLRYDVRNEAVHFVPWFGLLAAPGERFFTQVFGQLDIAASGNPVQFRSELDPQYPLHSQPERGTFGKYNDPTLLSLDWQAGYWLLRNPASSCLTGLASVLELRYTTSLKDVDHVAGSAGALAPPNMPPIPGSEINFRYTNPAGRYDILNLTIGLHAVIRESLRIRIAEALPLRGGDQRSFDAETLVQIDLRF